MKFHTTVDRVIVFESYLAVPHTCFLVLLAKQLSLKKIFLKQTLMNDRSRQDAKKNPLTVYDDSTRYNESLLSSYVSLRRLLPLVQMSDFSPETPHIQSIKKMYNFLNFLKGYSTVC